MLGRIGMKRLLYYNPFSAGGLADYAHEQANALAAAGIEVTFLATPGFAPPSPPRYLLQPALGAPSRLPGKWRTAAGILGNMGTLRKIILRETFPQVLLASYGEYLAPLWSGSFRDMAGQGTVFGAVVHDPVRDHVVGPLWWHRRSIAAGYSFLREAFVHEAVALDTAAPMPRLRTTVIPHGPYSFPASTFPREHVRRRLEIPGDATVLLSFGYIRDNKNLNLLLRAMQRFPEMHLIVAGQSQSSGQRPVSFYRELARSLGVDSRCHWEERHIPRQEVGDFFQACDHVVLTYSASFRSASGVLHAAAHFRKPCLASAGAGSLRTLVRDHHLGVWVEPDDPQALEQGLAGLRHSPAPDWDSYERTHSWTKNAALVAERLFERSAL
jgi:glycosyltransferase involved in cell wall biosynthesis